jgi:putative aldouronate transport system permease protein
MQEKLKAFRKDWRTNWVLYLMALPCGLAILVFCYLPMAGIVMAFQNLDISKGIFKSPFVGLKNFEFLFATTDAWRITRNTILYNVVFILLGTFLSITLALILNEMTSKRYTKTLQTIYMMPNFLSIVVVSMIVYAFLNPTNGFLNRALQSMGLNPVNWYNTPGPWPFILVLVNIWKGTGFSAVVYLAIISGISVEYYEAAALDGASRFQQMIHITIPHLRIMLGINLIRSVGGIIRGDFGLFYNVPRNSGALYPVTDILDTYIYRGLFTLNNPGMSTAAGLYQSLVGLVLVLISNKIVSLLDEDCALF